MPQVRFGTAAPSHTPKVDGKPTRMAIPLPDGVDHVPAEVNLPDSYSFMEMLQAITTPTLGFWDNVSDEPPLWVSSDNPRLAETLGEHYGCKVVKFDASIVSVFGPASLTKVTEVHQAVKDRAKQVSR